MVQRLLSVFSLSLLCVYSAVEGRAVARSQIFFPDNIPHSNVPSHNLDYSEVGVENRIKVGFLDLMTASSDNDVITFPNHNEGIRNRQKGPNHVNNRVRIPETTSTNEQEITSEEQIDEFLTWAKGQEKNEKKTTKKPTTILDIVYANQSLISSIGGSECANGATKVRGKCTRPANF